MNDQELKPCPFCGSTKVVFRPGDAPRTHIILCLDCDISAGEYYSRSEVIEAWNRRPDTTPWTTITADPATLPPDQEVVLLAVWDDKNFGEGKSWVVPGWRRQVWGVYYAILKTGNTEIVGNVYKWQPLPTPPPYPSADEQNEGER